MYQGNRHYVSIGFSNNSCVFSVKTFQTNAHCKYCIQHVPYFFDYKTEFFSFQNNPKDLDPSSKTDLDLWDCLGRAKIGIIAKLHRTDLVI